MRNTFSLLLLILLSWSVTAQSDFVYNKRFQESVDKWVALPQNKDSSFGYGFIYLDLQAGLTLHYQGKFIKDATGKLIASPIIDSIKGLYKVRLKPGNIMVSWIPSNFYQELDIKDPPDWLHIYKHDTTAASYLQRMGFFYNDFGMSEKALEYLEPGYKQAPEFEDMAVELAFAYNALNRFSDAIPVLKKAIELTPDYWYLFKELSYAYLHTKKLEDAGDAALKGIQFAKTDQMKSEMAYNLAYSYFQNKDKANFSKWAKETLKWTKENDEIFQAVKRMESKLN